MVTPQQLRDLLTAHPFRAFRIHLSDGRHFDIINHDMALVGRNTVEIGLDRDPDGFAERFVRCSLLHITRLEGIEAGITG